MPTSHGSQYHVPWMNEHCRAELFGRAPDGLERRIVQIDTVDASGMRVRVHVRADLRAAQAQLANATLQFARRKIRILHRNRGKTRESLRMFAHDLADVIVQPP